MNIKYFGTWKDTDGNLNRVELLTNNAVINPIKVDIVDFVIDSNIDLFSENACMGAGAKFSIVSQTKLQYLNELYAINIKELKVIHYINSKINFIGYLNTEVYNDNFFDRKNYKIDLTANDGLSILNRIKLTNNSNNLFEGIVSSFDVLQAILRKLDIGYKNVNIALSSTIENYSFLDAENLLQKIYVNTDNYVDEKGNVMSCREVLDSILTPLTAKLYIYKNEVYIIDINNLAKDNITFKKYTNPNLNYVQALNYNSTYTENNLFDIDVLVGNHNSTYSQGVNKLDVKFNKYVYDDTVEIAALTDNAVSMVEIDVNDNWKIKEYTLNDNSKVRQQIDKTGEKSDEFYFYSTLGAYKSIGTYSNPLYAVEGNDINIETGINITSSRTHLKISADVMIEDYNSFETEVLSDLFQHIYFMFKIKVGDRIYKKKAWVIDTNTNSATTMDALSYQPVYLSDDGQNLTGKWRFNKWYNLDTFYHNLQTGLTIPLNSDLGDDKINTIAGGDLNIKIACQHKINSKENYYNFRFKNIKLTFLVEDEFGNLKELDNTDSEIQGTINDDYINSESIDLIHGTDEFNNSRGGLLIKKAGLYSDSEFATNERLININNLIRNGKTGQIEELLLNTYLSNFQLPRYVLNCSLQGYYKPFQLFKYDLFNRNNVAVKMAVNSIKTDYINSITDLQIREIVEDIL